MSHEFRFRPPLFLEQDIQDTVQSDPSGRGKLLVDNKLKVLLHYKLLILNRSFLSNVNKRLSVTRWATL